MALECVLALQPNLADDVARIAAALSAGAEGHGPEGGPDASSEIEAIAGELEKELVSLDILDLSRPRLDPFEHGGDANDARDRLHQAVAPSVEAMVRLIQLGRQVARLRVLQGVLLGLYRVREGERLGELLAGAPDPDETAVWVWETWQRTTRGRVALHRRVRSPSLPRVDPAAASAPATLSGGDSTR